MTRFPCIGCALEPCVCVCSGCSSRPCMCELILKSNKGSRVGRPSKNYIDLHIQVPEVCKEKIESLSALLECSNGEVVVAAVKGFLVMMKDGIREGWGEG